MIGGGIFPGWIMLLAPVIEALLVAGGERAAAGAAAPGPGSRPEPPL
jgi:hypothetical protein